MPTYSQPAAIAEPIMGGDEIVLACASFYRSEPGAHGRALDIRGGGRDLLDLGRRFHDPELLDDSRPPSWESLPAWSCSALIGRNRKEPAALVDGNAFSRPSRAPLMTFTRKFTG